MSLLSNAHAFRPIDGSKVRRVADDILPSSTSSSTAAAGGTGSSNQQQMEKIDLSECYYGLPTHSQSTTTLAAAETQRDLLSLLATLFNVEGHTADPFRFPFDVYSLAGYTTVVEAPLDLSLVGTQVIAHGAAAVAAAGGGANSILQLYTKFQDAVVDVFLNCCCYHQVGSPFCAAAIQMLQLVGSEFDAKTGRTTDTPFYHTYLLPSGGTSSSTGGGDGGGTTTPPQQSPVLQVLLLNTIAKLRQVDTLQVLAAVDPLIDGVPTSLDKLLQRVVKAGGGGNTGNGSGSSPFRCYAEFHRLLDVMLASVVASAPSGSPARASAVHLRSSLPQLVEEVFADTAALLSPPGSHVTVDVKLPPLPRRVDPWLEEPSNAMPSADRDNFMKVLLSLVSLDVNHNFTYPVLSAEYLAVIPQPMDFTSIKYKLVKGLYPTTTASSSSSGSAASDDWLKAAARAEVLHDVELIYDNCLHFNGPAHPLTKEVAGIRSKLPDLLLEFGLQH